MQETSVGREVIQMVGKCFWGAALLIPLLWGFSQNSTATGAEIPEAATAQKKTAVMVDEATFEGGEEEKINSNEEARIPLEMIREFWKREEIIPRKNLEFPGFRVPPRKGELELFPCLDCHEDETINIAKERKLTQEHESIVLDHGGNRFWCPTCHNLNKMDFFRSMKNLEIDFNKPFLLCGQCHSPRQKDWFFGGHGKRIGNWQGEKVVLSCTECHDPHSPSIKPKRPDPPPEIHPGPSSLAELVIGEFRKLKTWVNAEGPKK